MIWVIIVVFVALISVPPSGRWHLTQGVRKARVRTVARSPIDMGMLVTEVATRLRSGATIEGAWASTLRTYQLDPRSLGRGGPISSGRTLDDDGVPLALRRVWEMRPGAAKKLGINKVARETLPATFAVCRMGFATGAPMAEVFDACALGISESGEARSAREIALAGPVTSAKILAALPLFGIALSIALGVNPLDFYVSGLGRIVLIVGLTFEMTGIMVVRRLIARARAKEEIE